MRLERGELIEWTPQLRDDILREAAEAFEHGKPIRDAVEPQDPLHPRSARRFR